MELVCFVTLKHSRPDSYSPQKQDGLDDSAWSTEGGFIGFASGYFIQLQNSEIF